MEPIPMGTPQVPMWKVRLHEWLTAMPIIVVALAVGAIFLVSCDDQYASSKSDTHTCVFDGSERGGQKLKFQIPPGAKSKKIDDNDVAVAIPASNRFFMATEDDTIRDPLAPHYYRAFARGNVAVRVEGQVRFRFNLERACEWYSVHGRRNADENGDLGFNFRGDDANTAGWFRYLAENFGVTMDEVADEVIGRYDPYAMHFNYPENADETGVVPVDVKPGEATNREVGRDLGLAFTERLDANLGTKPNEPGYFCGIDPVEGAEDDPCPPMLFQVRQISIENKDLANARERVAATHEQLQNAELEGQLQQEQAAAVEAAEAAKRRILAAKLATAEVQAQIDTASCRIYAQFGLDCEGHHAPIIAGNNG